MIQNLSLFSYVKHCFKCGLWKPLDAFYKHPRMADGHLGKCKECTKKDVFDRRHGEGRERVLEYDRARAKTKERKALAARIQREYYQKYPDRWEAVMELQRARRAGTLVTPTTCSACGEHGVMHAHHNDYSKPLDIEWLCNHCHRTLRHGTYVTP